MNVDYYSHLPLLTLKRNQFPQNLMVNFAFYVTKLLCRLPTLAEARYRDHYPSSCVVGGGGGRVGVTKIFVTFFSRTTEASFLIFGTEHQYRELHCVSILESAACPLPVLCDLQSTIFKDLSLDTKVQRSMVITTLQQ